MERSGFTQEQVLKYWQTRECERPQFERKVTQQCTLSLILEL